MIATSSPAFSALAMNSPPSWPPSLLSVPTNADFLLKFARSVSTRITGMPAATAFSSVGCTWSACDGATASASTPAEICDSMMRIWPSMSVSSFGPRNDALMLGSAFIAASTPAPTVFQ